MPPSRSGDGPKPTDTASRDAVDLLGPDVPAGRPHRAYRAYRSRAGARWLLPADRAGRAAARALYAPQKPSGHALLAAMRLGLPLGGVRRLDPERIGGLTAAVGDRIGVVDLALAFSFGPPRPDPRLTAAAMDRDGRIAAFVKIAGNPAGAERLGREAATLRRLADTPLADRVPAVLGEFYWAGLPGLVLEAGPAAHGPTRPGDLHVEFLRALAALGTVERPYGDSETAGRLRAARGTEDAWSARFGAVDDRLTAAFGGDVLPLRRVHHDFAPWNTRRDGSGLWVFDWESAADEDLPLMDELHLGFAPAALTGRSEPAAFVDRALEEHAPVVRHHRSALRLAYLAGACLRYGAGRRSEESPIVSRALREIDQTLAGRTG